MGYVPPDSVKYRFISELHPSLRAVKRLCSICRKVPLYKKQCTSLAERAEKILETVNTQLSRSPQLDEFARSNVKILETAIEQVLGDMHCFEGWNPMKCLLRLREIERALGASKLRLNDVCIHFSIASLIRVQERQEEAKKQDLEFMNMLCRRHEQLLEFLEVGQRQQLDAMYAMQEELAKLSANALQRSVLTVGFAALQQSTGRQSIPAESWKISIYDVDIDEDAVIGKGGFAIVKKATFFGHVVAVKLLAIGSSRETFLKEVTIWDRLRHDHVLQMFGACDTSDPPFIVSKYMKNGNVLEYLACYPEADRRQIVHEVALGMTYLHGQHVIHGDLKGSNILVDDAGKACIADFGTSKLKQEFFSRTATTISDVIGSLRFMAPEHMEGRLIPASDVYSYAMVVYQIFTGDVPFMLVPDPALYHTIVILKARLEKPTLLQHGLTSDMWELLTDCSNPMSAERPTFAQAAGRSKPPGRTGTRSMNTTVLTVLSSHIVQRDEEVTDDATVVIRPRSQQVLSELQPDKPRARAKALSDVHAQLAMAQHSQRLGNALLEKGEYTIAIATLRRAKAVFIDLGDGLGEAECMQNIGNGMYLQDDYAGATAALEQAQKTFEELDNPPGMAQCLRSLGEVMNLQCDYAGAKGALTAASIVFNELCDRLGEAQCIQSLGDIMHAQSDYDGATAALEQAKMVFDELGDHLGNAQCTRRLGDVMCQQGNYTGATAAFEQAKKVFKDLGNRLGEARCTQGLGDVMDMQSNYTGATAALEQAKKVFKDLGNRLGEARCTQSLANVMRIQSDYTGATAALEQAKKVFKDLGNRLAEALCTQSLANVMRIQSDYTGATAAFEQAKKVFKDLGERLGEALCTLDLAYVMLMQSDYTGATAAFEQAKKVFKDLGDRLGEAQCTRGLADVMYMQSDYTGATAALEQAKKVFKDLGNRLGEAQCTRSLGSVMYMQSDYTGATAALEQAKKVFKDLGNRLGEAQCTRSLGGVMYMQKDYAGAAAAYEEAKKIFEGIGRHNEAVGCENDLGQCRRKISSGRGLWRELFGS